jgi:hypothetical protein
VVFGRVLPLFLFYVGDTFWIDMAGGLAGEKWRKRKTKQQRREKGRRRSSEIERPLANGLSEIKRKDEKEESG